jgi:hypothetical protein
VQPLLQWESSNITLSECGFVAVGVRHAMRTHHIVTWPALLCNIFPHYVIKGALFEKQKLLNVGLALLYNLKGLRETDKKYMLVFM